ncbi:lycopene cyclase domain-containing protein [Mycetocola sp. CAN_C7]|uniref:lycopene cyclase domain-containing protein n=1 Tax=Mycetocola sp. CAN_C7 TaxID=2787724 RepID=UPI0018CA3F55
MTYLTLSIAFLAVAAVVLALALATRDDRSDLVARWRLPVLAAGVALMVLTALFDNVMIATGLMVYEPGHLAGILIGSAPLEDFAYPLAGLLLLPALWSLLGRRSRASLRSDE